ncbi:MAG: hypothetical protein Q9183_000376 [Haloplaca sp. 2 TL-2023]
MLSYKPGLSATTAVFLAASHVNAFWRLECDGSVGVARLDPLMDFGGLSGHVHAIKGASAFTATSTAEDLLKSNCQSCGVAEDKSAYWAPPLYHKADDGTLTLVPEKPPFKAYYIQENTGMTSDGKPMTCEAFPNGFQMIAGTNTRRNSTLPGPDPDESFGPFPDDDNAKREERALGFNCMNYGGNPEPTLYRHHMPEKAFLDANCPDGLRLELQFPSCWNGEMDGGKDHKNHVAYPEFIGGGNCPAGFDRRVPSLLYETIYATDKFAGKGYGYHGDFIAAWDEGVLKRAVKECTNQSGQMRDCGVFTFPDNTASCTFENPVPDEIKDENTEGPMQELPGGCEIQEGPEPAVPGKGASGSSSGGKSNKVSSGGQDKPKEAAVKIKHSDDSKADVKPEGAVFAEIDDEVEDAPAAPVQEKEKEKEAEQEVAAPAAAAPSPETTAPPAGPPADDAGKVFSTTIYTEGRVVHKDVFVMEEVTTTQGAHGKRHNHRHHHAQQHGIGGRRLR